MSFFRTTVGLALAAVLAAAAGCHPATPPPAARTEIIFRAHGEQFEFRGGDGAWRPVFLRGVNLGAGIPGAGPNFPDIAEAHYALWFRQMTELGANCLRVYNLQPAAFYRALDAHNRANPATPLYLVQGVWLDDGDIASDLTRLTDSFNAAIEQAVRRVHGRDPAAATPDVSRWTCAFLIGREVMPAEVRATDESRGDVGTTPPDFTPGRHFRLKSGTRTERWIAARLEHLVAFERAAFGTERPVGFSSWPPLDPLRHPTESLGSGEDSAAVDLANLEAADAPAGFFVSYHAYPYNPDFMNEDPGYQKVCDADGPNPYLGYLRELKAHYRGIPLLVAEFGVPSSWACARFNPAGMGHGGHDETEQARINARLFRSIRDSGCAGAVYFSWLDEWWKGNWITRKLNFPQERRRFWHNLCDPEANYGLVAFDPVPTGEMQRPPGGGDSQVGAHQGGLGSPPSQETGSIREIRADADSAYFRLRVTLDRPPAPGEPLVIGLDTYGNDVGENILPGEVRTTRRCEFALVVNAGNRGAAQLYVTPAYDLCGIFHGTAGPEQLFHSVASSGGGWRPVRWQNAEAHASPDGRHVFPAAWCDVGRLRGAVVVSGNVVDIRIPYALLQFTDPSARRVMDDNRATPERETAVSQGIAVAAAFRGSLLETGRFRWEPWNAAPPTTERLKPSYFILRDAFRRDQAPAEKPAR